MAEAIITGIIARTRCGMGGVPVSVTTIVSIGVGIVEAVAAEVVVSVAVIMTVTAVAAIVVTRIMAGAAVIVAGVCIWSRHHVS